MEEKNIKINNIEVSCKALIEFSSLASVLLELVKRQEEMEKKLNDQDIKINNIKKLISKRGGGGGGINNWQEKENEISNILKDDDQYNIDINFNEYNNRNMNNDSNNEMIKDNTNDENDENKDIDNSLNNLDENDKNKEEEKTEIDKEIENISQTNKKNIISNESSNEPKKGENELISNNVTPLDKNGEDDIKINNGDKNNNSDFVSKTFKKVVLLEKKVGELVTKSGEHQIIFKNLQSQKQSLNEHSKNIKNINESTKKLKNELEKIKEKLQDFNIFDMFKDSGDGNIDMAKGMVMALESKLKKRLDLMDEKYKLLTNENLKNKGDIQNLNGILDNSKILIDKNTKTIEEIINSEKDKEQKNKEEREKDNNDINQKMEKIIKDIDNIEKNSNNKFNEIEEKLKNELKNISLSSTKVEKRKSVPDMSNNIREMNEKLLELEKNVKYIFKKFNIDEINNNLSILQKEVSKKGNQGTIDDLSDRIYIIDELLKEVHSKCDSLTLLDQKNKEEYSFINKKLESLNSQIHRMSLNVNNRSPKEEKSVIDFTKFIDLNTFEDNKKEINRKFDKVRISFEDILRNIEEILNKLSHTPSDKDFSQFQGVIKNMLDELKLTCNKRYADKYETIKNIKFLETQIKTINDQYIKKAEGQDNWLLAKKPMSNYLCASCEGVIRGELDKRSEFIPWNKYPNREDKYTRMGHGFSHMLQLVNDDIRKNVDSKEKIKDKEKDKSNEKEYNSDEDKKKNASAKPRVVNSSVKLPKVRQRPRNYNNLNILDEAVFDKAGNSPYENVDKNQSVIDTNNNTGPHIIKIAKLKKITNKKSFQETSVNEEHSHRGLSLNIKTFPSELDSFEKKQGDLE